MDSSFYIARLLGPVLLAAALPMVFNPTYIQELADEFLKTHALMYVTGVMVMLGGLGIVNKHNIWVMGWPVMITLFGWAMIIGGAFRVVLPSAVISIGSSMLGKPFMTRISGVVWLVAGAFLSYKGYS